MRKFIGKMGRFVLFILIILTVLPGCSEENEPITELWVVIDNDDRAGMYGQAGVLTTAFEKEHQGVTVKLEAIPTKEAEREVYLEHLRTQIMAGQGPDAYILPGRETYPGQVFKDVAQSMYNGLFADISAYYDADSALHTEELVTAVMDAGCVDDARYVLPLRYEIPVAYVDRAQLDAAGLDTEIFASGMMALMDTVIASGDEAMADGASARWIQWQFVFNFFPKTVCYDTQEVKLTAVEVAEFLRKYQALTAIIGKDPSFLTPYFGTYCLSETFWAKDGYPFYIGTMSDAPMNAAIGKLLDVDLEMYPVAASDGSVVADITYYCAVSAKCGDPALAYDYLRLFLTEESQWEENRQFSRNGLIAKGWPVRTGGSAEKIWKILCDQDRETNYAGENSGQRKRSLLNVQLTDEDLPILQSEIDAARFPISLESDLARIITESLNDPGNGYAPANVDIDAVAKELIRDLQFHVAEG